MRIHRLEVQDFRGVEHAVLEVPETGVLVVEGPNEAGKSTLVRALDLLLAEKASSRKQQVRDCQPIGQDVAPRVTAELTVGGERFTYTKQWVRQPRTEFRGLGPGGRQLTGDDAHAHVTGLLEQHGDETLRRALQLLQEGSLTVDGLGDSRRLGAALDAASGGDTGRDLDQAASLVERVEDDASAYWTGTGRPTGELRRLQEEHAQAVAVEDRARAAVEEVEGDVRRVAELGAAAERAAEADHAARERQVELERRWAATRAEREAVATATEDVRRAEREHARAVADAEGRQTLVAEATEAEEARVAAVAAGEEAAGPRQAAEEAVAAAGSRRQEAEEAERSAREQLRTAEEQVVLARAGSEVVALRRRVERLDQLAERQRSLEELLEGTGVDDAALQRVTGAEDALRRATARREASHPRLQVSGGDGVAVTVDGEDLPAGERPWEAPVAAPTTVAVAGVQVRVVPPEGSDDAQVDEARRVLAEVLADLGADDVAHAHRLHAQVLRATADREDLRAQLEEAGEGRGVEEWRAEASRAASRVEAAEGEVPDLAGAQATAEEARSAAEEARETLEAVRAEEVAARERLTTRRTAAERAEARREAAVSTAERVAARVAAAREVATDEAVAQAVVTAEEALTVAREELAAREEALAAVDPVVEDDLASARTAAERSTERARRAREELLRAEAMLAQAGQEGRAEELDVASTHREHVEAHLARVQSRADALGLLLQLLRRRRAEAQASYVAPFREALEELGAVVHGQDFAVEVAPDLTITSRSVGGVPVPVEMLSTGAREQLAVLSRLAVARVVDAEEGVPVVLDDALGWSDPDRLLRMARALEKAGREAQVLVLTCTPGRYDAVVGATVRTTDELRVAARS